MTTQQNIFPVTRWRVLDTGDRQTPEVVGDESEAAWNMAVDETLLDKVSLNAAPPTLRLYRWERPALTLGRFQDAARTVDLSACAPFALPVARRITGGRGILHGSDLTVAIAAPVTALGVSATGSSSAIALYRQAAQGFLLALSQFGFEAEMGVCSRTRGKSSGDCFAVISAADIIEARSGRKLMGAALHRRQDCFLLQASLQLDEAGMRERMETLRRAVFPFETDFRATCGLSLPADRLALALRNAFSELFGTVCESGDLTPDERRLARERMCLRYLNPDWTAAVSR